MTNDHAALHAILPAHVTLAPYDDTCPRCHAMGRPKRITVTVTVQTAKGPTVIVRNGTLTGETSPAGMLRVKWDSDGYGQLGWITPAECAFTAVR